MTRKTFRDLIKTAYGDFIDDEAMRLAASLSFYALFALGPMLIIIIAVAGLVWGRKAVRGEIVSQFSSTLGEAAASQIEEIVTNAN